MKTQSPILCKATPSRRRKSQVLRITVFRRSGSRFWQARVSVKGKIKRITTRTQNRAAAEEFAMLAYRYFSSRASDEDFARQAFRNFAQGGAASRQPSSSKTLSFL